MRRFEMFLAIGVLVLFGMAGCCNCPTDDGSGPPGPKTTIEPDGESLAWTDDGHLGVKGDASGGEINARFVNRKIDKLRACATDVECDVADEIECEEVIFLRTDADGNETSVRLKAYDCSGGNRCIEWYLTGYTDPLTGRATGNSRHLPAEFFPAEGDTTSLTCDGRAMAYAEIDWKGGA